MDSVHDLRKLLFERTELLRERSEMVDKLEKIVEEHKATIQHLRNEIDKFRQIVDYGLKLNYTNLQKWKRQGISAEPIKNDEKTIKKFSKPERYIFANLLLILGIFIKLIKIKIKTRLLFKKNEKNLIFQIQFDK